ncbi:MAG: ABC transporter ATP-binding protein [Bdellovibrio sp.]|nr:ABC transporter ATP-binding protein [Bdellovibrio sp.]
MSEVSSIRLENLKKSFHQREVIQNLNLEIQQGSFVSLVGPSGCGKSTVLRLIAGLESPTGGLVELDEESAGHFGFVFQDANLLPWKTVYENVALPFELSPALKEISQDEIKDRVLKILTQVKLQDSQHLFPHQLSGGMKMRVSLARALAPKPRLLLMDEPFAALDEITRYEMQIQLRDLWQQEKLTVIFVTHSLLEATFLSERVVLLKGPGGRVTLDRKLDLPIKRDDSLRTSESFNKIIQEISAGLKA